MNFIPDNSDRLMNFNDYYSVKARIDGIDVNSGTIIEIKTKSNIDHSITTMELKDRIQCLVYMKISGLSKCLLVESDSNGQMKIFRIFFDESEFLNRIDNGLIHFVNKYRNLSEHEFYKLICKYSK